MIRLSERLGDVSKVQAGQSAPKKESFSSSGIPFVRAGSLEFLCAGGSEQELELIPGSELSKLKMKLYKAGTVVFAKSGMSATLGRVYKLKGDCCVVSHLATVSPNEHLDSDYLKYWFLQNPPTRLINDPSYPSIRASDIEGLIIPLPPLETQKQIAAMLEKADQLRKDCKQMEQELNNLAQSVFIDMFGDPVTNPKGWEVRPLIDLLYQKPQIGTTKPSHDGGVQSVVRVGELGKREVAYSKCGPITLEGKDFEKYKLEEGDFLLARAIGSRSHLGKASLYVKQEKEFVYDSHVMRLRFNDSLMSSRYFYEMLKTHGGRTLFLNSSSQTAVQFNINAKQISQIQIPVPPKELQSQFFQRLEVILAIADGNSSMGSKHDDNFNSIMQKAFKGELDLKAA